MAVLKQRNTDIPLDWAFNSTETQALELFKEQMQVMSEIIGIYCEGKFDESKFTEAKESYMMNCLGISP